MHAGEDVDENEALEGTEIDESSDVCNADSPALVHTAAEAEGEHCEPGGQRIDAGLDVDGDGTLSDTEVDATSYVCSAKTKGGGYTAAPGTGRGASPWGAAVFASIAAVFARRRRC